MEFGGSWFVVRGSWFVVVVFYVPTVLWQDFCRKLDAEERAQVNEQRREQYALESALQTPAAKQCTSPRIKK